MYDYEGIMTGYAKANWVANVRLKEIIFQQ